MLHRLLATVLSLVHTTTLGDAMAVNRGRADSVDADNAWGPPSAQFAGSSAREDAAEADAAISPADIHAKEQLVRYAQRAVGLARTVH